MSALAEALVAAQRRALAALEKGYVRGGVSTVEMRTALEAMGCTDKVDMEHLLYALDTIRAFGASVPTEPANGAAEKPSDKATDAQLALIAKLVKEKNVTGPDLPITKGQAHEIIDSLKAGTYDAGKWTVPF